jgi:hypothetical protein
MRYAELEPTMNASATWESVLAAPAPRQHIAQLYTEPGFLARAVGRFAGEGLRRGEAVVLVVTPSHWQTIARGLEDERFALDDFQHRGQLTVLDAAECVAQLLVNGMPDRARFRTLIGGTIEAATAVGHGSVRAFGEMVDLLRRRSLAATIRLEELWAELMTTHAFSLLCGYSLDNFDSQIHRGLLQRVSAAHSDVIPVDDYARLERAVERAYADIFGPSGEPTSLRSTFLAHYARPAAMPDAEAAILAVREFVPVIADALLDRARRHYRTDNDAQAANYHS